MPRDWSKICEKLPQLIRNKVNTNNKFIKENATTSTNNSLINNTPNYAENLNLQLNIINNNNSFHYFKLHNATNNNNIKSKQTNRSNFFKRSVSMNNSFDNGKYLMQNTNNINIKINEGNSNTIKSNMMRATSIHNLRSFSTSSFGD